MIENVKRCNICKRADCDGKEYKVAVGTYLTKDGVIIVCTSQIFMKDGKRWYRHVMGHGCEWDIMAIPKDE